MAHSYASEYPANLSIDAQIVQKFEDFYRISDTNTPEAHEQYVSHFTKDATFIMASKTAHGHEEIMALRKGMWTHIIARRHTPLRIFPFGTDAADVMLYGTVAYELRDGRKTEVEWAARAQLVRNAEEEGVGKEGKWRFGLYQVYLDPMAWQSAK